MLNFLDVYRAKSPIPARIAAALRLAVTGREKLRPAAWQELDGALAETGAYDAWVTRFSPHYLADTAARPEEVTASTLRTLVAYAVTDMRHDWATQTWRFGDFSRMLDHDGILSGHLQSYVEARLMLK